MEQQKRIIESLTSAINRLENSMKALVDRDANGVSGRKNIRLLEKMTGEKHEIIESSGNPAQFIKNALKPARVNEIRITERPDGKSIAVVSVNPRDKV